MSTMTDKTVRDWALETPAAARVFEKLGIDYCCGGGQTLKEACQAAGVPLEAAMDSLDRAQRAAGAERKDRDWQSEPLSELIENIKNTHHQFVRQETARLGPLFEKVCAVHGRRHPELARLQSIFHDLAQELAAHLFKEEAVLFPYIVRLEEATIEQQPVAPAPFGTVRNPVAMMLREHDDAGSALRALRRESGNYAVPNDACASYQSLYRALAEFEADLHQHIHLENNILFPRAIEIEGAC
jgi:regulator of cell morphogenesis and NO signaling